MSRETFKPYIEPLLDNLSWKDAWTFLADLSLLLLGRGEQPFTAEALELLRRDQWAEAVRRAVQSTGVRLPAGRAPMDSAPPACIRAAERLLEAGSPHSRTPFAEPSALLEELLREMVQRRLIRDFVTPPFLADMMARMLELRPGSFVLDPACGSGGLLLAAQTRCPGCSLAGIEIDPSIAAAALVRLRLGGVPADVEHADFFRRAPAMESRWDAVLSNPPYTRDLSGTARFLGGFLQVLKPGGRCAVLVPEGFLSSTACSKANTVRRLLLQRHTLEAVVSLPPEIYFPYTVSHSSLLLFRRGRGETRRDVFFSRVLREEGAGGEAPGGAYLPGIERVLDAWKRWSAGERPPGREEPGAAWWTASHEALAQGGSIFPAEGGLSAVPSADCACRGSGALRRAEERQDALESLLRRYIGGTE